MTAWRKETDNGYESWRSTLDVLIRTRDQNRIFKVSAVLSPSAMNGTALLSATYGDDVLLHNEPIPLCEEKTMFSEAELAVCDELRDILFSHDKDAKAIILNNVVFA